MISKLGPQEGTLKQKIILTPYSKGLVWMKNKGFGLGVSPGIEPGYIVFPSHK